MNNIQQLLHQLCPNGVEYKRLGEVCEMQKGTAITKKEIVEGDVPVIAGGKKPAYYCNKANREPGTIVVAGSGAYAGFVSYWEQPIFVSDAFSIRSHEKGVGIRYAYHFLKNMQDDIYRMKKGGGVPHVYLKEVARILIPLPPLPVQRAIAAVLDRFTQLETELETELQCRKKQYEYYRDSLLNFDDDNVQWVKLEELCEIRNGYTPSKKVSEYWENGTIPWFRMEDIRKNGRILSDSIQHITPEAVKNGKLFSANSIIIATTATIGEHALLIVDALANQRFTNLTIRKSLSSSVDIKYFYYYMFIIDEWCKDNTNVSGFASVDMKKFKKVLIPLPSLPVQRRIVGILDRFEALTTSISEGLPAEIDARRRQYEYYRDRLLTFKRKEQ